MISYPTKRGELIQSPSHDGWTVYEPEGDSLHVLNDTARAIWELCDGETSLDEMALAISDLTGLSREEAQQDVSETVETLEHLGLVVASLNRS